MTQYVAYNLSGDLVPIESGGGSGVDEEARSAAAAAQTTANNAQTTAAAAQDTANNAETMAETAKTTAETALEVAGDNVPFNLETEEPIVINFHHLASGNGGESSLTLTVSSEWTSGGEEVPIQTAENDFMKIDLMSGIITFYPNLPSARKTLNLYSLAS